MSSDDNKRKAALEAINWLGDARVIGVGTGSTVNHFIDALKNIRGRLDGAVSSSEASRLRLKALGIPLLDANAVGELPVYVDGADEVNHRLQLIKGGGGALTREKIVAAVSRCFVCIVDRSKLVDVLGAFPLPIEVIPMARSYVARELAKHGGQPEWRRGFITDNGNVILDIRGLAIPDPPSLEVELNQIAGVVSVGLFARRPADIVLVGDDRGVTTLGGH